MKKLLLLFALISLTSTPVLADCWPYGYTGLPNTPGGSLSFVSGYYNSDGLCRGTCLAIDGVKYPLVSNEQLFSTVYRGAGTTTKIGTAGSYEVHYMGGGVCTAENPPWFAYKVSGAFLPLDTVTRAVRIFDEFEMQASGGNAVLTIQGTTFPSPKNGLITDAIPNADGTTLLVFGYKLGTLSQVTVNGLPVTVISQSHRLMELIPSAPRPWYDIQGFNSSMVPIFWSKF